MKKNLVILMLVLILGLLILFQSLSIVGGDAGELSTASFTHSIPHAPGFPLYTMVGSALINFIPLFTVAWRMSLLSSIPAFISRIFLFLLLLRLTKSNFFAIVGTLVYTFIYPVWLFSSIPEVVSLNSMFLAMLIYLSFKLLEKRQERHLIWVFIISGVAFFHNYYIAVVFPGIYYVATQANLIKKIRGKIFYYVGLFSLGLIPYIYFAFLSTKYPVIDTEHPANIFGLLRLITRSSYGTFKLSDEAYFNFNSALNSLINLGNFIYSDFKIIGIVFAIVGLVYLFNRNKKVFYFMLINFSISIFFFAYASFPLYIDYHFAIFEKYLFLPYFYISISFVLGFYYTYILLNKYFHHPYLKKLGLTIIITAFIFYPSILFKNNYIKIIALKNDFTAENLGRDILASIPKNSIVDLQDDTSIYNTMYVHYVLKERPDIYMVKFNLLNDLEYRTFLRKKYPKIYLPDTNTKRDLFSKSFFEENSKRFSILNSIPISSVPKTWLPNGLLWEYYPSYKTLPTPKELILSNLLLWQKFHFPFAGTLQTSKNLLLSDVLRVYSQGHQSFGLLLYKNKQYDLAENEFRDALNYNPMSVDNYNNLSNVYLDTKKCNLAEDTLIRGKNIFPNNKALIKNLIILYVNCYNDSQKAEEYAIQYRKL